MHVKMDEIREVADGLPKQSCNPYRKEDDQDAELTCVYSLGEQHCVAGEILWKLGVQLPPEDAMVIGDLPIPIALNEAAVDSPEMQTWLKAQGVSIEEKALKWLRFAQRRADSGYSWGESMAWADEKLEEA